MVYDLVIIGGGASGLIASIFAKEINVCILEKNSRVGKKILTTGNGRCNFTNRNIDIASYHSNNISFVSNVFKNFGLGETLDFFESIGIVPLELDEGKIYPASLQASSVLDMLRYKAVSNGVNIITEFDAKSIQKKGNIFYVKSYDGKSVCANNVIIATGGKTAPKSGSDGFGYKFAEKFGHKTTLLYPSLVQLKCPVKDVISMKGIRFDGIAILNIDDVTVKSQHGEILFTEYGLSGPAIFQISGHASKALEEGKNVECYLDIIPFMSLENFIGNLMQRDRGIVIDDFLTGLFNKRVAMMLLKKCGIDKFGISSNVLTNEMIIDIANTAKKWKFDITGTNMWDNAQVTGGGICLDEINADTMESKLVEGLFFSGEILDVDGDCGGFNLQWAWSSGSIAGMAAADKVKEKF